MNKAVVLGAFLVFFAVSCSPKEFDPNDPKGSFAIAKEPYDDGNHEMALQRLGEFKSRFPYSQYAVEAELLVANSYFELARYAEASAAYEQFTKLHPKHAQVDFALFRIGESYWREAPEEIDREQEYTEKALAEWQKLVERLPNSPEATKAREFIAVGRRRLADNASFVAHFYCKLEFYDACAYRYINLVRDFGEFKDLRAEALLEGARALDYVAQAKDDDKESDKNLFHKKYSADAIRAQAAELRRQLAENK